MLGDADGNHVHDRGNHLNDRGPNDDNDTRPDRPTGRCLAR